MPYSLESPPDVIKGLPTGLQKIFIATFNSEFAKNKDEGNAMQMAWGAVKKKWVQKDGKWTEIQVNQSVDYTARTRIEEFKVTLANHSGLKWEATFIAPGISKGSPQYDWRPEFLEKYAKMFIGVDINAYEMPDGSHGHLPEWLENAKSYLVTKNCGRITQAWYAPDVGVKGIIEFWDKNPIVERLTNQPNSLGLSIDSHIRGYQSETGPIIPTELLSLSSVDIVTRPAAGGKFHRAVAAQKEDRDMPDEIKNVYDELEKVKKETQRAICNQMLEAEVSSAKLPNITKEKIRRQFSGEIFEKDKLMRAIQEEKDYLIGLEKKEPNIAIPDQRRPDISQGPDAIMKIQMACDRLFNLSADDLKDAQKSRRLDGKPFFEDQRSIQDIEKYDEVPPLDGIGELYQILTGDSEVRGFMNSANLSRDLRATQTITSGTFSYILGNTLYRRLVKDYAEANYRENLFISNRKAVKDFRQQEAVLVGYFGDIATVDPEAGDYAEIAAVSDEESTYTIAQKGNILTITRRTIINDDISLIKRMVTRLGRAARRTHAKYVWNFFVSNTNCSDGTAWFTSGHGNLGATALSFATVLVAYKALAGMTEKDSGEALALLDAPKYKPTLIYPVDLMETGETIVNDDFYYATNDLTDKTRNPLKGKINGAMSSLMTDANDWGLIMPPQAIDMVEMGYLNGRQEPEMFVADTLQSEQIFVADKVRYKIRHEYAGAVVDYRSGYKAVVA